MTFSPMALNNLNNPYSPQPSTPVGCLESDPGQGFGAAAAAAESAMQQREMEHQMRIRSRHCSAESEPALRTLLSPVISSVEEVGFQRLFFSP